MYGPLSKNCQMFMSEYCATKWDSFCEAASNNPSSWIPNSMQCCLLKGDVACSGLRAGDVLIRNTAARKYLIRMYGARKKYEPFDPNVPNSALISYWISEKGCPIQGHCSVPVYAVDPKTIDADPVMNKILDKPGIAPDILTNIYQTMKRMDTLKQLRGTRLGHFYSSNPAFKDKGGL